MTHPLADMPDRPPGRGPSGTAATGEPSLSMQQRTVLERLITRLVALTSQQNAEVWACVKHDLGLKGDSPLLAPRSQVYAVEYKGEACALIRANRERFGAYNLEVAEGRAPAALAELPAPDGVFIGGSEGELIPILEAALSRNPAARFCVTAIAVETLGVAVAAFTQLEMSPQITQITVARSRRAGERNLMLGQNPVWIVTGQKEALL